MSNFILTSHGLPGLRTFILKPHYDPDDFITDTVEDPDPAKAQAVVDLDTAIQQAINFKGVTIGPVQPPSLTDPSQLVGFLISLKHQLAAQGWLCGRKYIADLDKTLDLANDALSKVQDRRARDALRSFIAQLSDQRRIQPMEFWGRPSGRDDDRPRITSNAYYILTTNAEYILSQIPHEDSGRDDHQEDKRLH